MRRLSFGLFALVLGFATGGPRAALAEEPLRLLVERGAISSAAECAHGSLLVVRSFAAADLERGVRIGDTLELPRASAGGPAWIPAGVYPAVVRDDGELGWRIEIEAADGTRALRAKPARELAEAAGSLLVGRRPPGAPAGACDPAAERLEDSDVLMRRLRGLYASPGNDRPIEIRIQP
jgi:hypothetical protein